MMIRTKAGAHIDSTMGERPVCMDDDWPENNDHMILFAWHPTWVGRDRQHIFVLRPADTRPGNGTSTVFKFDIPA